MFSNVSAGFGLFVLIMLAASVLGWLTHIYVCIVTSQFLLLIAGAILVPIGVLHGWGVWFGLF